MEEKNINLTPESENTPNTNSENQAAQDAGSIADQILAEYSNKSEESAETAPVEEISIPEAVVESIAVAEASVADATEALPADVSPVIEGVAHVTVEEDFATEATEESTSIEAETLAEAELDEELVLDGLDKKALFDKLEHYLAAAFSPKHDAAIRKIKEAFDLIDEKERQEAFEKFLQDGGEEDAFEFKRDGLTIKFNNAVKLYRERRRAEQVEAEKAKEHNQALKIALLDELRQLVESDEGITSIQKFRDIEERWKAIGPVPNTFAQEIRSNYSALRNLFYDRRSIYFELMDLDRKKNLETKLGFIEKAKALLNEESLNKAVKDLNDLHEEWRNTGPVPKEEQEKIWADFKAVSDEIYAKRRAYLETIKVEQTENLKRKELLIEKAKLFSSFTADRFDEWNTRSQEVMKLEEEWKTIGNVPIEKAGDINKAFWGYIKNFFSNKHGFFKALDKEKAANLAAKTRLCEEAEALQDSEDWEAASNELKRLQTRWKEVGQVPTKVRESIYARFKAAADKFFERKRQHNEGQEQEYGANLEAKQALLKRLEDAIKAQTANADEIVEVVEAYNAIGFVPRKAMDTLSKDAARITENYLSAITNINPTELIKLKVSVHAKLNGRGGNRDNNFRRGDDRRGGNQRGGGNQNAADNSLRGMERNLRNKIQAIENQIHSYENNLSFFANSRNVDSLRKEVEGKVKGLQKELVDVRDQLKIIQQGLAEEAKAKEAPKAE